MTLGLSPLPPELEESLFPGVSPSSPSLASSRELSIRRWRDLPLRGPQLTFPVRLTKTGTSRGVDREIGIFGSRKASRLCVRKFWTMKLKLRFLNVKVKSREEVCRPDWDMQCPFLRTSSRRESKEVDFGPG